MYTTFTCPNCKKEACIQEVATMIGNYYECEKCGMKFTLRIEVSKKLEPFDEYDAMLYEVPKNK